MPFIVRAETKSLKKLTIFIELWIFRIHRIFEVPSIEVAENFEKCRGFKDKFAILEFKKKFGQISINIVILDYFGYKNDIFFSILKKLEKFFRKFSGDFGKFFEEIAGHKTPNKNAMKYELGGT